MIKQSNNQSLIVTDALDMLALREFEHKEVRALKAGCHLLLCPLDVPKAIDEIKQALIDETLSMDIIDNAVEKIVRLKFCRERLHENGNHFKS
jgi:beta-glucosidase-like glycosyl hydrolase